MEPNLPETLYHYCSVQTFYNIMKNRCIWLSDISKSNDSEELHWIQEYYKQFLHELRENYVKSVQAAGLTVDYGAFEESFSIIRLLLEKETYKYWVFCLSQEDDDLGQWRGYADDGRGVALGFQPEFFALLGQAAGEKDKHFSFCFRDVKYGKKELDSFFEFIRNELILPIDNSKEAVKELLQATQLTIDAAPWFKNEGFKEEKEWRIIFKALSQDLLYGEKLESPYGLRPLEQHGVVLGNWGYIAKGNDLVSHVELGISNFKNLFTEIIIGPKCNLTENEIYLFLISCGIIESKDKCGIKIRKSKSTYR